MAAAHPPGFYKTNPRAMTIGEMLRWYGWLRLPRTFIACWSARLKYGCWMPGLFAEMQSANENLSPRFLEVTARVRDHFSRYLGFSEYGILKIPAANNLNPNLLDSGTIHYVHSNRSHVGGLTYNRVFSPIKRAEFESSGFFFRVAFTDSTFACTNLRLTYNGSRSSKVIYLKTEDPAYLYDVFLERIARIRKTPLSFPDHESLRRHFDEKQWQDFNSRADRRLFVRMSDAEVEELQRRLPPVS